MQVTVTVMYGRVEDDSNAAGTQGRVWALEAWYQVLLIINSQIRPALGNMFYFNFHQNGVFLVSLHPFIIWYHIGRASEMRQLPLPRILQFHPILVATRRSNLKLVYSDTKSSDGSTSEQGINAARKLRLQQKESPRLPERQGAQGWRGAVHPGWDGSLASLRAALAASAPACLSESAGVSPPSHGGGRHSGPEWTRERCPPRPQRGRHRGTGQQPQPAPPPGKDPGTNNPLGGNREAERAAGSDRGLEAPRARSGGFQRALECSAGRGPAPSFPEDERCHRCPSCHLW
ncbi:hypothetical protein NDU88_010922 [Pleurodeles waltl]|uniref:Uncharacterized protein n=1 Tax=Pleurodeles waltl TaxID=8319 RepID=A0AAV7PX56_PLEWA|nr:hypothetical protein NDU88_010922 [Pleurodeles waltl]